MKIKLNHYFSNVGREFETSSDSGFEQASAGKASGFYAVLGEKTVGLFVYGDRLFVMVDGDTIEANESLSIHRKVCGQSCKLAIRIGKKEQFMVYACGNNPVSTQYYSEDDEDADFGLWISNVIMSEERKKIMIDMSHHGSP